MKDRHGVICNSTIVIVIVMITFFTVIVIVIVIEDCEFSINSPAIILFMQYNCSPKVIHL